MIQLEHLPAATGKMLLFPDSQISKVSKIILRGSMKSLIELNKEAKEVAGNGNIYKAIELLNEILVIDPLYFESNFNISILYSQIGEKEKSVEHYLRCLTTKENDRNTVINLSHVLVDLKQFNEVTKILKKYIISEPDDLEMENLYNHTNELKNKKNRKPFLFVPSNDTHVNWMLPMLKYCENYKFLILKRKKENADLYLQKNNISYQIYEEGIIKKIDPSVLIFGCDWASEEQSIIKAAKNLNIPTVIMQEGCLDLIDPKGRMMHAEYAFLQGSIMKKYIQKRKNVFVTGNPKYDDLKPIPLPRKHKVMINSNFTYGVMEDERDRWVSDTVKACIELNVDYFVSKHPRDIGVFPESFNVMNSDAFKIKEQMESCSIFISRFSTVIYEIIALGRDVVYYNPHNEYFRMFKEDKTGGIHLAGNYNNLKISLSKIINNPTSNFSKKEFLEQNCNIKEGNDLSLNCVKALSSIVDGTISFDTLQSKATESFIEGTEALYNGNFDKALSLMQLYKDNINYEDFFKIDNRVKKDAKVSVVIVAYNTNGLLLDCINSLLIQTDNSFEVIVIDNGKNEKIYSEVIKLPLLYVQCPHNYILSEGRNIGAYFSKTEYLAFLDDDALVSSNYISSIIKAFETFDIYGFRGKVLPKTEHINNKIATHYDFGELPFPYDINTEGNSAYRKDIYMEFTGMNPLLFGSEGSELCFRITKSKKINKFIYWPETVIYHDYADNDNKKDSKQIRHDQMKKFITTKLHSDFHTARKEIHKFSLTNESRKIGFDYLENNFKITITKNVDNNNIINLDSEINKLNEIIRNEKNNFDAYFQLSSLYFQKGEVLRSQSVEMNDILQSEKKRKLFWLCPNKNFFSSNSIGGHISHATGILTGLSRFYKIVVISPTKFLDNITENVIIVETNNRKYQEKALNVFLSLAKEEDILYMRYYPNDLTTALRRNHCKNLIISEVSSFSTNDIDIEQHYKVLNATDIITVVTKELEEETLKYGGHKLKRKVNVIPNAVDPYIFNGVLFTKNEKVVLSNKLGISESDFVISFSGKFIKQHGLLFFLDVLNEFVKKNDKEDIKFLLIGSFKPDLENEFMNKVKRYNLEDKIVFTGDISYELIPQYLNLADVLICPQQLGEDGGYHQSPVKLYEYLSMGKLVLCQDIGQMSNVIVNGQNGYLLAYNDLNSWLTKLEFIKGNLYQLTHIKNNARNTIVKTHNWSKRTDLLYKIIEDEFIFLSKS